MDLGDDVLLAESPRDPDLSHLRLREHQAVHREEEQGDRVMAESPKEKVVSPPRWQELRFPSEERYLEVQDRFADLDGVPFHELPGWIRLGWPDEAIWNRANRTEERELAKTRKEREPQPWPVARQKWEDVLKR